MCRMPTRLRFRPNRPRRSSAICVGWGLAVSNVNANCSFGYWKDAPPEPYFEPSLISPNPQHRHDRIELIGRAMQFAKTVGSAQHQHHQRANARPHVADVRRSATSKNR